MTTLAPHRLSRVLSYIDERLNERISVRDLAGIVHMSPFHFTRVFKVAVGLSPHAYLTHVRMEHASQLLTQGDTPIAEIARRVGFRTQAHFTCIFRRHARTTPHAYRVAHAMGLIRPGNGELPEAIGGSLPVELPAAAHHAESQPSGG